MGARELGWHEEVLDAAARKAAERLAGAVSGEFYLAGGTALALRWGHRVSLDFDLFSRSNRLGGGERRRLIEALKASGALQVLESKDRTLHLRLGSTAASLFHYPYPRIKPTAAWRGLQVAADEDIAAMKLSAVVGRGARKDFADLYVLCRGLGLGRVLAAAVRRFPDHPDFDLQASRALVYFEDAEKEPMPRLLRPLPWLEIRSYFEREVPKAVRRRLR